MAVFRFILLASASLLFLTMRGAATDNETSTSGSEVEHGATRVNCRTAMNKARTAVGLPSFEEATDDDKLPIVDPPASALAAPALAGTAQNAGDSQTQQNFLDKFCAAILAAPLAGGGLTSQDKLSQLQKQAEGTYMYYPQTSKEQNCTGAIEYWKSAVTNFSTLPPYYSKDVDMYSNHTNISLVGLYNTDDNPKVDCAVITCNSVGDATARGDDLNTESELPKEDTPGATSSKHTLLCLSKPRALEEGKQPFTQEQWSKITGFENSASQPAVFAVLAAAAALVVNSNF